MSPLSPTQLRSQLLNNLTLEDKTFRELLKPEGNLVNLLEYCCSDIVQSTLSIDSKKVNEYIILNVYRWSQLINKETICSPSVAFLIDFINKYYKDNQELVKRIITNFIDGFKDLETQFISSRVEIVDYLRTLLKRIEKGSHNKLNQQEQYKFKMFLKHMFEDLTHTYSTMFEMDKRICNWFNITSDYLSVIISLYSTMYNLFKDVIEVNELVQLKKKYLKVIYLCLSNKFIEPIFYNSITQSQRLNLFDQMYNFLIKYFQSEVIDPNVPIYNLVNANIASDLNLNFEFQELIQKLLDQSKELDLDIRKSRIEYILNLLKESIYNVQILPDVDELPPKEEQLIQGTHNELSKEQDLEDSMIESKITNIKEIFPDLSTGFIRQCLNYFNGDNELLIMKLLEDALPEELNKLDRNMKDNINNNKQHEPVDILSTRRNIHDGDEFDIFSNTNNTKAIDKMYIKDNEDINDLYKSNIEPSLKYNILNLNYDDYDDEYSDEDTSIKAPIINDASNLDDTSEQYEFILYNYYISNPNVFNRDKETRKSKDRIHLKSITNMSDEQIEGWFSMLKREPFRLKRLQNTFGIENKDTNVKQEDNKNTKGNDQSKHNNPSNSNNSNKANNNQNKAYKQQNKAKIANHSRKQMRQKKMDKQFGPNQ